MPPNAIPEYQISNFLSRHTSSLPVYSLPNDSPHDQQCPICHIFYADPPRNYIHPECPAGVPEYACQIRNVNGCKHIFGRRCLERHIRGNLPWSHTCPMCRQEWLPAPNRGRTEMLDNIERALNILASVEARETQIRRAVADVERELRLIRTALDRTRWV
jgi:hypothetical protein